MSNNLNGCKFFQHLNKFQKMYKIKILFILIFLVIFLTLTVCKKCIECKNFKKNYRDRRYKRGACCSKTKEGSSKTHTADNEFNDVLEGYQSVQSHETQFEDFEEFTQRKKILIITDNYWDSHWEYNVSDTGLPGRFRSLSLFGLNIRTKIPGDCCVVVYGYYESQCKRV